MILRGLGLVTWNWQMRRTRKKNSFPVSLVMKNVNWCVHLTTGCFFFFSSHLSTFQDIDEGDIQALDALHSSNAGERKTLADLIFSKLEAGDGQTAIIRASNRCTLFSHLRDVFLALRYPTDAHIVLTISVQFFFR